jgi:hypothetical protein
MGHCAAAVDRACTKNVRRGRGTVWHGEGVRRVYMTILHSLGGTVHLCSMHVTS